MNDEVSVEVTVSGVDEEKIQTEVIDVYEENIETFIRKNINYGNSFKNSAKLDSILRYGEVREDELFDIISRQILVRGFYDKLSRFHQLQIQGEDDLIGEEVEDTLLDLGNYAIMLAAMRRKWSEEEIEEFIEEFDTDQPKPGEPVDPDDFADD